MREKCQGGRWRPKHARRGAPPPITVALSHHCPLGCLSHLSGNQEDEELSSKHWFKDKSSERRRWKLDKQASRADRCVPG